MTSFVLKIAALLSMLIDHLTAVFLTDTLISIDEIFGRLAFPLYAFMIVDSFRHLYGERFKKFMIILGIMAIISEPAFDYAMYDSLYYPEIQNQLLQFFSYGLAIWCIRSLKTNWQKILVWLVTIAINHFFALGYGWGGIVLMLIYEYYLKHYEDKSLIWRFTVISLVTLISIPLLGASALMIYLGFEVIPYLLSEESLEYMKLFIPIILSIPFITLYNGKYGNIPKWFRFIYRYFYPAHLYILCIVKMLFLN